MAEGDVNGSTIQPTVLEASLETAAGFVELQHAILVGMAALLAANGGKFIVDPNKLFQSEEDPRHTKIRMVRDERTGVMMFVLEQPPRVQESRR